MFLSSIYASCCTLALQATIAGPVAQGEPFDITLSFRNTSESECIFVPPVNVSQEVVWIDGSKDSHKLIVFGTRYDLDSCEYRELFPTIYPGESFTTKIRFNDLSVPGNALVVFPEPGHYRLTVSYTQSIEKSDMNNELKEIECRPISEDLDLFTGTIRSDTIDVFVNPYNLAIHMKNFEELRMLLLKDSSEERDVFRILQLVSYFTIAPDPNADTLFANWLELKGCAVRPYTFFITRALAVFHSEEGLATLNRFLECEDLHPSMKRIVKSELTEILR